MTPLTEAVVAVIADLPGNASDITPIRFRPCRSSGGGAGGLDPRRAPSVPVFVLRFGGPQNPSNLRNRVLATPPRDWLCAAWSGSMIGQQWGSGRLRVLGVGA